MQHTSDMLKKVSRTFTLSIEQLPQLVREAIKNAYLLLRVSDGLEDHPELPVARKVALLHIWDAVLAGEAPAMALTSQVIDLDSQDPEVYVIQQADQLVAAFHSLPTALQQAMLPHVRATTQGMARWQQHGPHVADEAELDDYMHEVAGRVGYLITDVCAWYSGRIRERREVLLPLSRECGLALQAVNVIRGMRRDYERGWVFVPQSYLRDAGITAAQLFEPRYEAQALGVVARLAEKAERHLEGGLEFIVTLPQQQHRIRLACMWPVLFAVKTLAISRDNPLVLHGEAKITRDDIQQIMRKTMLMGWSNRWLDQFFTTLKAA